MRDYRVDIKLKDFETDGTINHYSRSWLINAKSRRDALRKARRKLLTMFDYEVWK